MIAEIRPFVNPLFSLFCFFSFFSLSAAEALHIYRGKRSPNFMRNPAVQSLCQKAVSKAARTKAPPAGMAGGAFPLYLCYAYACAIEAI